MLPGIPDNNPDPDRSSPTVVPSPIAATPPESEAAASVEGSAIGAPTLSAEEQMALFEQDLKEHDWGHQPC